MNAHSHECATSGLCIGGRTQQIDGMNGMKTGEPEYSLTAADISFSFFPHCSWKLHYCGLTLHVCEYMKNTHECLSSAPLVGSCHFLISSPLRAPSTENRPPGKLFCRNFPFCREEDEAARQFTRQSKCMPAVLSFNSITSSIASHQHWMGSHGIYHCLCAARDYISQFFQWIIAILFSNVAINVYIHSFMVSFICSTLSSGYSGRPCRRKPVKVVIVLSRMFVSAFFFGRPTLKSTAQRRSSLLRILPASKFVEVENQSENWQTYNGEWLGYAAGNELVSWALPAAVANTSSANSFPRFFILWFLFCPSFALPIRSSPAYIRCSSAQSKPNDQRSIKTESCASLQVAATNAMNDDINNNEMNRLFLRNLLYLCYSWCIPSFSSSIAGFFSFPRCRSILE